MIVESPANVLATYLVSRGVGAWPSATAQPWTITYANLPNEGQALSDRPWVALYDTGARQDPGRMRRLNAEFGRSEYPQVDVRIRASSDEAGLAKGKEIADIFDDIYMLAVVVDGITYTVQHVQRLGRPAFLKQEEKYNMRVYVLNTLVRVTEG